MSNNMQENMATPMPSHESSSASEEHKTSSESTRLTREEMKAIDRECREAAAKFMAYLKENNIQLFKPCPAPKVK